MEFNIKDSIQQIIKKLDDPMLLFPISFGLIIAAIGIYNHQIVLALILPLLIVFVVGFAGAILLRYKSPKRAIPTDQRTFDKVIRSYTVTGRHKEDIHSNPGVYFMENRRWITMYWFSVNRTNPLFCF